MKKSTRRSFLKQAAAVSTAFPLITIAGTKASGRVLGANDVIRVGVVGIHGQGNAHIDQYLGLEKVQVTHLIDPDRSLFESRGKKIRDKGGNVRPSNSRFGLSGDPIEGAKAEEVPNVRRACKIDRKNNGQSSERGG